ncbi:MAG TPA: hypothetical protein PLN63_07965 [Paludibacteraceae bacterium]|nr:hypothetical protein [Paludibacteraceae bacterium]
MSISVTLTLLTSSVVTHGITNISISGNMMTSLGKKGLRLNCNTSLCIRYGSAFIIRV